MDEKTFGLSPTVVGEGFVPANGLPTYMRSTCRHFTKQGYVNLPSECGCRVLAPVTFDDVVGDSTVHMGVLLSILVTTT